FRSEIDGTRSWVYLTRNGFNFPFFAIRFTIGHDKIHRWHQVDFLGKRRTLQTSGKIEKILLIECKVYVHFADIGDVSQWHSFTPAHQGTLSEGYSAYKP